MIKLGKGDKRGEELEACSGSVNGGVLPRARTLGPVYVFRARARALENEDGY